MNKKHIKKLVIHSYKKERLDSKIVQRIADLLSRSELKDYLNELKRYEKKRTVIVSLTDYPTELEQKKLGALFPHKKIVYNIDPSLLTGMRVMDDDVLLDINLKNTLDELVEHVTQTND